MENRLLSLLLGLGLASSCLGFTCLAPLAGRAQGRAPAPPLSPRVATSAKIPGKPLQGKPAHRGAEGGALGGLRAAAVQHELFADRVLLGSELCSARIVVRGTRIASVQRLGRGEWEASRGENAKDLGGGCLVVPAFINAHSHLSMACIRGAAMSTDFEGNVVEDFFYRIEGNLLYEDVRAFTRMGCWESLLLGVGCAFDHYYFADALVEAFKDTGMTGVIAPTLQDLEGPGLVLPGCGVEDTLATTLKIHKDKKLREEHGIAAAVGAHATDTVSAGLWQRISKLCGEEKIPIHAHVAQSIEEFERCQQRHGTTPVRFLQANGVLDCGANVLLVHSMYVTSDDLDRLDKQRHTLGLCPSSAIQFGFPCDFMAWHERGLKIALGTDAAVSNDGMNVQQEMRSLAGGAIFGVATSDRFARFAKEGTMDAASKAQALRQDIFRKCTDFNDPAKLLSTVWANPGSFSEHMPVGKIEEGHLANLLVIRGDHPCIWPNPDPLRSVAFADVTHAIDGMMVGGKWVGEIGNFQRSILNSDLYKAHAAEANERIAGLMKRAKLS